MPFLETKLTIKATQKTILTPRLVQMVSLLALNKVELRDMIAAELVENPVLEEAAEIVEVDEDETESKTLEAENESGSADRIDEAYERLSRGTRENDELDPDKPELDLTVDDEFRDFDMEEFDKYLNDTPPRYFENEVFERPSFENFLTRPSDLSDHLEWQLGLVTINDADREACRSIIGNLNSDGYLAAIDEKDREIPLSLNEIALSGNHSIHAVERALLVVQGFDPPGVAARDLRECLLIQLALLDEYSFVSMDIVTDFLGKLQNRRYKEIAKVLKRPLTEVLEAVDIIKHLDPRPGQKYNRPEARTIEPDVFIIKMADKYTVVTNEDELPHLRLNPTYRRLLDKDGVTKEVQNYVKDSFKSALQLLQNIEQRKNIIVKVCEAIIRRQTAFLNEGINALQPMMIKEVAEEVGVHPSTVSRAVANKFAYTPHGMFELRFFFSEAVNGNNGSGTSLTVVKLKVKRLIENEDPHKPLTDDKISSLLKEDGISLTRRSITKYREDLKIPSTHQRKERS